MSNLMLRGAVALLLALLLSRASFAQATLTPLVRSFSNLDAEELDDIDFVEDLLDAGLPFIDADAAQTPSAEPLTNDEDDEPTRILYAPVDLSGVDGVELQFVLGTEGGFDAGAAFSISAVGIEDPLFSIEGAALGQGPASNVFASLTADADSLIDSAIDLTSVEFEVLLDPGFDGDDETIFFDSLTVVTSLDPVAPPDEDDDGVPPPDDGTPSPDDGPEVDPDLPDGLLPGLGIPEPVDDNPFFPPPPGFDDSIGALAIAASAVPEPGTLGLLASMVAGIAFRRRRDV